MHIYVRRGGPNYQTGLAKMRKVGEELGVPLEVTRCTVFFSMKGDAFRIRWPYDHPMTCLLQVYGPEATMTGICKEAIDCVMSAA